MTATPDTLGAYVGNGLGESTGSVKGRRPVLRRKYLWAVETARDLVAANQDPKTSLRREIMFALRRCGPISTVDLIELLIVALDSDEDLTVIAEALRALEDDPQT
jgi:hypothetical protein